MSLFYHKKMLQKYLEEIRENAAGIGFVPTMGALHEGHLSIVKRAVKENDVTVVSIFVNPTQFDKPDDLEKYPRALEKDIEKLYEADPRMLIYIPEADDIYGAQVVASTFNFGGLEDEMEGKYRKDHFNGVATVVKKLFEIVMPHRAYFGEKDYQQLLIVKKLTEQLHLPVEITGCLTAREAHGLAMSSRNERLSPEVRKEASFIYNTLMKAREKFESEDAVAVKNWVVYEFENNSNFTLEYVEIADAETLKPVKAKLKDRKYRIFAAVHADGVRLIDNIALN